MSILYDEVGSPPRVREKLIAIETIIFFFRITPASAGKTGLQLLQRSRCQDHPRECGKNKTEEPVHVAIMGSPPRVREKLDTAVLWNRQYGITPASAGKTGGEIRPLHFYQDHPRECGKNLTVLLAVRLDTGSPPRVREKRIC